MNKDQLANYLEAEKRAGVKYVALQDCDFADHPKLSNCIRQFHPNSQGIKTQVNIDTALDQLPDYVTQYSKFYKLHTKRALNSKWKTMDLPPDGEPIMADPVPTFEPKQEVPMNDVRSFEEALKDKARISELESKVRELSREIADLEATIEELETEVAEEKSTQMADANTTALGQVATLLPGIIDKFFELQERKINAMGQRNGSPMPKQQPNGQYKADNSTVYEDYGL